MITILIIDDNEEIRYALSQICDFKGWNALTAPDVKSGVEIFTQQNIDLVLIDYHMPVLNGLEGVKMLRNLSETVPVIVLTVDENQEVADAFMQAGASDFALKPIKAPDLVSRISVHLKYAELDKKKKTKAEVVQEIQAEIKAYKIYKKGISLNTLEIIERFFMNNLSEFTIDEISEQTGLAYQTVHRYLKHFIEFRVVQTEYRYGKVGRPKQHFWWVTE